MEGDEEIFYYHQQTTWTCRVSEAIDVEYEEEREAVAIQEALEREIEIEYMEDSEVSDLNPTVEQNNSWSGLVQMSIKKTDISMQTDQIIVDRPKLRVKTKVCTEEVKATCTSVSA